MRCLTLADGLADKGAQCTFICREHQGNLIEYIRSKDHDVHSLPMGHGADTDLAHRAWLGATQAQDIEACIPVLAKLQPNWVVLDHYALDTRWEVEAAKFCTKLMVIDDLADRPHACNLLLDQTFGRDAKDYRALVPANCTLLCGSNFALLRPEFAALRPYSLQRREHTQLKHLLVTMGGVDQDNATGEVLQALCSCPLSPDSRITVVMGPTAPWLEDVKRLARNMPWPTRVLVGVSNMAELMAESDLAIGAAGATSWERCCLGLPTALMVLADNQRYAAELLEKTGAVKTIFLGKTLAAQMSDVIVEATTFSGYLKNISFCARSITDGHGCVHLVDCLYESK